MTDEQRQAKREALQKRISGNMSHEKGLKEIDIKALLAEEVGRLMKEAVTNKEDEPKEQKDEAPLPEKVEA